jgi:hypothetical protein
MIRSRSRRHQYGRRAAGSRSCARSLVFYAPASSTLRTPHMKEASVLANPLETGYRLD